MSNIAIILSGGKGSRFGGNIPKQFTKLAGRAILEYTVEAFQTHSEINEILIVSSSEYIERTWDLIRKNNWFKVTKVIAGGEDRFDSTHSALRSLDNRSAESKVMFHDAVRPLVDHRIISDCLLTLDHFQAVDVVVPSPDTLVQIQDDSCIKSIPDRASMRRGQTPQAFLLGIISEAYEKALQHRRSSFTCDCSVVRAMLPHLSVATIPGSERNIKITRPIDLFIVEKFLQSGAVVETLSEQSLRALNIAIIGGSSGIGKEIRDLAVSKGACVAVASRSYNNVDIKNLDDIKSWLSNLYAKWKRIDCVINTAGLLIKKPIDHLTSDEVSDIIGVNYTGAVNAALASKRYLGSSSGMLLNFTSSSYTRGRALYAMYSSSKSAIVNLTQALADEWREDNIRVNCINPERTATPMRTRNFGIEHPSLLLSPRNVAETSLKVLLSDLTGIIIDVRKDGR